MIIMEISYNIRIFIQLSAKQQNIYNSTAWQKKKYLKDLK